MGVATRGHVSSNGEGHALSAIAFRSCLDSLSFYKN
jgi:hypothetical protein